MTDIDQGVELGLEEDEPAKGGMKRWLMIGGGAVLLLVLGGAGWYFFLGGKEHFGGPAKPVEAPLPSFLDLKPLVVTVPSRNGPSRFVQLGVSFQLSDAAAGEMITAVLPKVQDGMRQVLLTFKSEDLQTPEGIDKARAAMLARLNAILVQVLGRERVVKATGGKPDAPLIQNIYFATLIIE
jgi:flagellar FliL protein